MHNMDFFGCNTIHKVHNALFRILPRKFHFDRNPPFRYRNFIFHPNLIKDDNSVTKYRWRFINMAASMSRFSLMLSQQKRPFISCSRNFHRSRVATMPAHDAEFNNAKDRLNTLSEAPDNNVKLQIYGLFKQATEGKCNKPKPGMMDLVGKAKWQAWNSNGDLSQDDAQKKYIEVINELVTAETPSTDQVVGDSKYKMIHVTKENKIYKIILNRPKKKNALNQQMYAEIVQALDEAGKDNSVLTVITGAGDYYCSGNDLENFAGGGGGDIPAMAKAARETLLHFVAAFIDFPKPLIGLVNGPAVGVSVTTLGLFDVVFCSDRATFHTPFSALGQSPEGCSSYIFPKLMGTAKASELLLFNKKINAHEAMARNLVTEVIPDNSFETETTARVLQYAKLPPQSLQKSKTIIRQAEKALLHKVNGEECNLLVERWQSDECMNAIMNFFKQKTSKL